ncbi:MAG: hypothetical protein K0S37_392 [Microbacterium sp.]|jgi:hypothetical protein|nr:hypothetical protein [Microbacterium sp.]
MCAESTIVWMKDENTVGFQQAVLTRWSDNHKHVITAYPIDWKSGGCNS